MHVSPRLLAFAVIYPALLWLQGVTDAAPPPSQYYESEYGMETPAQTVHILDGTPHPHRPSIPRDEADWAPPPSLHLLRQGMERVQANPSESNARLELENEVSFLLRP